jgi:hypothetical protein
VFAGLALSEVFGVRGAKRAADDFELEVMEGGLRCRILSKNIAVDYPWQSLRILGSSASNSSIEIEDRDRPRSKIELVGFENMQALVNEIRSRCDT